MVLAVCVAAVAADFVGLNPEQLARVGRQQEEAVQVRARMYVWLKRLPGHTVNGGDTLQGIYSRWQATNSTL